jgi:hypothetical protein
MGNEVETLNVVFLFIKRRALKIKAALIMGGTQVVPVWCFSFFFS